MLSSLSTWGKSASKRSFFFSPLRLVTLSNCSRAVLFLRARLRLCIARFWGDFKAVSPFFFFRVHLCLFPPSTCSIHAPWIISRHFVASSSFFFFSGLTGCQCCLSFFILFFHTLTFGALLLFLGASVCWFSLVVSPFTAHLAPLFTCTSALQHWQRKAAGQK